MDSRSFTPYQRAMITLTVMLVAVVEVLDMTITNVSLPAMMGSLSATSEQITWVLTSYIVSSAMVMPLSGFLINRFGRKQLLLINILGFMIASALCGMATSLAAMVFFRTLQGVFGACLVPLSQYILRDTYPPEDMGKAMAIWGIGIMTGPILGPTLGGYINIPVCILGFFLSLRFIQETERKHETIDWVGLTLLSVAVAFLQIFLDRGNSDDWFQSHFIQVSAAIWISAFIMFVIRGFRVQHNIINLDIFRDKNFSLSVLLIIVYCLGVMGTIAVQPMMLESVMHYPTATTGLLMAPRGVASALGMMVVGKFSSGRDPRIFISSGMLITIIGTYMMCHFALNTSQSQIMWVGAIQGFGMGLYFVPIAALAFATMPREQVPEASGLFSFGRSLGSSIGIAVMSSFVSHEQQVNWHHMAGKINMFNTNFQAWLQHQHAHATDPHVLATLQGTLLQQANFISYLDSYWLVAALFLALLPFIFLLKPTLHSSLEIPH